jgi:hypothetical protein
LFDSSSPRRPISRFVYYSRQSSFLFKIILFCAMFDFTEIRMIAKGLQSVAKNQNMIIRVVLAQSRPKASSTHSQRIIHQSAMKEAMREKYLCKHPTNENLTKCLVLNTYFSTNEIANGHIVGIEEKNNLELLGLHKDDLFNYRNGLLIHRVIEDAFTKNEVVRRFVLSVLIFTFLTKRS